MPRTIEIHTGKTVTVAGPARIIVYGKPTLTGTEVVPGETSAEEAKTVTVTRIKSPL